MKLSGVTWQDKIERARFFSQQETDDDVLMPFYAEILLFQQDMQARLGISATDTVAVVPFVPELLELLMRSGTPQIKELAAASVTLDWSKELKLCWDHRSQQPYTPLSFVSLTLLQPFARNLAARADIEPQIAPRCPFCSCKPQLGVLHPEGEGGKRYLLCSLCGTEWEYRRVICPNCMEVDKEKLPVYQNGATPRIKLAACDTCHTYLKCIDLSVDGHAVPEVDDLASLPMSLWMIENGFQPLQLNLFGF
jgi:FdhE protein